MVTPRAINRLTYVMVNVFVKDPPICDILTFPY